MTLGEGEILGVVGEKGAGISTLVKAIMMLVAPQAGRVLIMGKPHELASSRSHVAYLPDVIRPPGHLSGHDFITMMNTVQAGSVGVTDVAEIAGDLDFDPIKLTFPIRRYANDDIQKLGLIALLSGGRMILLLDRPMSDLEPAARAGLRHRLKKHASRGGAVLIGSRDVEDHQDVVDRLVMLKDCQLVAADTTPVIKASDEAA